MLGPHEKRVLLVALAGLLSLFTTRALGEVVEASPGDDIETIARNMSSGDTLILHGGTYDITCLRLTNLQGSDSNWTVVRAADGESPVLRGATIDNAINIRDCAYLHIRGLEIFHADVGVKFDANGPSHHVILEGLKIHEIDGVGISGSSGGHRHITIRGCEIYDTGRDSQTTGEGIYISQFGGNVQNLTIENCWIHHTAGTQSDGIDIKLGRDCIIRDNVIHDCPDPAIIVRGSDDANRPNLIERNVIWGSGAAGIETYGDCTVRNNVVFNCDLGLYSRDDSDYPLRNVRFINNTVYGCNTCLHLGSWDGKGGLVVANNVLYCSSSGDRAVYVFGGLSGVAVKDNRYYGTLYLNDAPSTGFVAGRSPDVDMLAPSLRDFYPASGSALIDGASSSYAPGDDFDRTSRPFGSAADVGAYEWTQAENPGWSIQGGFKDGSSGPPPDGDDDGDGDGGGRRTCGAVPAAGALLVVFLSLRRGRAARARPGLPFP